MTPPGPFQPGDLQRLAALHREVDRLAGDVARANAPHLVCRQGCTDCCQDDLTVLEIEAALILARREEWQQSGSAPHPAGRCAFLSDEGACRIYPWRPYVCRTQGLPLRWRTEGGGEGRSVCPLNLREMEAAGIGLAELPDRSLWTLGEWEGRLASLQAEASGRFALRRFALRDLWDRPPA